MFGYFKATPDFEHSLDRREIDGSNVYRRRSPYGCPAKIYHSWDWHDIDTRSSRCLPNRAGSQYSLNHVLGLEFDQHTKDWTPSTGNGTSSKCFDGHIRISRLRYPGCTIMSQDDSDWHCSRADAGPADTTLHYNYCRNHPGDRGAKLWYDGHANLKTILDMSWKVREIYDYYGGTWPDYFYYDGTRGVWAGR